MMVMAGAPRTSRVAITGFGLKPDTPKAGTPPRGKAERALACRVHGSAVTNK